MDILQTVLRYGRLLKDCVWQTGILIPKGNKEFIGIGLVEVLLKEFTGGINRWIRTLVQLHDVVNVFRAGWEMGNASLEANMIQQIMEMR